MKPCPPLTNEITVRGLVAYLRRETPRPVGEAQSSVIITAALICIGVGLLALTTAIFIRSWITPLGFVFVGAWAFAVLFLSWSVVSPIINLVRDRVSLMDALADLADRRRKAVRNLVAILSEHHDDVALVEAQKNVRSEIAAVKRRRMQMAGMTALATATAALTTQIGLGESFDNVAKLITASAPAIGVGAGVALVVTLDFLDTLERADEALVEILQSDPVSDRERRQPRHGAHVRKV